jgi:hypothetical protein
VKLFTKFRYEVVFVALFCLAHTPFLGAEMFNTDVWKWKARIYDFGSGVFTVDFAKTLQKYHPGVTLMWIGTAAIKVEGLYCSLVACPNEAVDSVGAVFNLNFFQQLFVVLAIGITLALALYPLRQLFGKKYSILSMLLLTFEPFFYALTRVIHLEALMTSFMLASFIWLFYTLETAKERQQQPSRRGLILSGILTGLALLTKSTAIFMLPFSGLVLFVYQRHHLTTGVKIAAGWLATVALTYFIVWPAMWVHPIATLDYVFVRGIKETGLEGEHAQIFLGHYTENPGPLYYLVVAAYKFSPVLITGIVLFALTLKAIMPHVGSVKALRFSMLALAFTLGYLLEVTIPTKKLDRYILPSLATLCLVAGFFYTWLVFVGIPKLISAHRSVTAGICAAALFSIVTYQSLALTPDYFSYYNPMAGGLAAGIYTLEPKWIIGQHQITKYFGKLMTSKRLEPFTQGQSFDNQKDLSHKLTVAFPEKYYTQVWPFIKQIGGWATIEDLTPDARKTTYFVYPVWDDYAIRETRFKLAYMDSIYLRGIKLYNVYQRNDTY